MKKKTFAAISISACLSFGAVTAFSGCGDSDQTVSIVDLDYKFSDTFLDLIDAMNIDLPLFEAVSVESSPVVASNNDNTDEVKNTSSPESVSDVDADKPSSVKDNVIKDNNTGSNTPVDNTLLREWREVVQPVTPSIPVRMKDVVPVPVQDNDSVVIKPEQKKEIITPDDEKEKMITPVVPDDINTDSEQSEPSDTDVHEGIILPGDGDDEEVIIPAVEPDEKEPDVYAKSFYREVFDNSKALTYSDSAGNVISKVYIHGTVDTYEGGELISSQGKDKAGTIEIRNLLTDDIFKFSPGQIEDYNEFLQEIFDGDVYLESKKLGASYSSYIEILDNNETSSYADGVGNIICTLIKHGTIETYENGELVSSEGDDKAGTIEIHNLVTDEIFTFSSGELKDYHGFVMKMFNGKAYWQGSLLGPAYAYPTGDDSDDSDESDDESDDYDESDESDDEADDYDESDDEADDYDDDYTRPNYAERKSNSDDDDGRELKYHLCEVCGRRDCPYSYYYYE